MIHTLTTHPMDTNNHTVRGHAVRDHSGDAFAHRHEVDVPDAEPAGVHGGSPLRQTQLGPIEQALRHRLYETQREAPCFDDVEEQRRVAQEDLHAIYQQIGTPFVPGREGRAGLREDDEDEDSSEGGSNNEDKEKIVPQDPYGGYLAVFQDPPPYMSDPGSSVLSNDEDPASDNEDSVSDDEDSDSDDESTDSDNEYSASDGGPPPSPAEPFVAMDTLSLAQEAFVQDLIVCLLLFPGAEIYQEDKGISHRYVSHSFEDRQVTDQLGNSAEQDNVESKLSAFAGFDSKQVNTDNTEANFSLCENASGTQVDGGQATTEESPSDGNWRGRVDLYSRAQAFPASFRVCDDPRCECLHEYDASEEGSMYIEDSDSDESSAKEDN